MTFQRRWPSLGIIGQTPVDVLPARRTPRREAPVAGHGMRCAAPVRASSRGRKEAASETAHNNIVVAQYSTD